MKVFNPNNECEVCAGSDDDQATQDEIAASQDLLPLVSCDLTTEHIVSSVNSREEYLRIFQPEDYPRLYEEE